MHHPAHRGFSFSLLPVLAGLLLCWTPAQAQPSNSLIWAEPSDGLVPARPEQKGIQVSASGALYVLVQRSGGTFELAIMRSTDQGATWTRAGASMGQGTTGSFVFASDGTTLEVLYTERSGTWPVVVYNRFDTITDTWLLPTDTLLFSGSFNFTADDIERTADDRILVIAETYQASPSQGIYYRFWDGAAWVPDPAADPDGLRVDSTYTSGIHGTILLDRSLPAASSEAFIYYRSATGSYGRIETKIHLGTFAIGPEIGLHGQSAGFLAGTANDRTANLQNAMRVSSGEIYLAFTANNSSNSVPRVRMGHRSPAGVWNFYDVDSSSNYQHGNVNFNDVGVGLVDGEVAIYYGKNTYSGSLTAQNGSGLYRKIWDPVTMTFGPEVSLGIANQNGTFGFLCTAREPIPGMREFVVYRDNTSDIDVYAYRDPTGLQVRTVSSPETMVSAGQTGVQVTVSVENIGTNPLSSLTALLSFTDTGGTDRSGEYIAVPDPLNPTTLAAGVTDNLTYSVDVLPVATTGAITVGASAAALDTVTMMALQDPDADTPHVWTVLACGVSLCGDCNGDLIVNILDALLAAQVAAGLVTTPPFGSLQFNACNVQGVPYPDPMALVDILDALELARSAAGLTALSCC